MNRSRYYNYIENKLQTLAKQIESRGKLNILDFHIHSENFYRDLFNLIFDWDLVNLNEIKQNVEAIDLIDNEGKIYFQVSATNTKNKIENSLEKNILKNYSGFNFKFLSLSKSTANLKNQTYKNPHNIIFNPLNDIYDIDSILRKIISFDIDKMIKIYTLIQKELGNEIDCVKLYSNLTEVINILSKEDLNEPDEKPEINYFEIERKIEFNNLYNVKEMIDDYTDYFSVIDKIYTEFDQIGCNKSISVLKSIRKVYQKELRSYSNDNLFWIILDKVQNKIISSSNYSELSIEVLDLCVNIIVVDAFIRCKIFKNPENYNYASS